MKTEASSARAKRPYQRMLLATDGAPLSRKAERAAIALAAATGAELFVFSASPKLSGALMSPLLIASHMDAPQVAAFWDEHARKTASAACQRAAAAGVSARPVTTAASDIAQAIIQQARKWRCNLVVMASHGRRGVDRVLLGSETQQVLVHSNVPVLVVR